MRDGGKGRERWKEGEEGERGRGEIDGGRVSERWREGEGEMEGMERWRDEGRGETKRGRDGRRLVIASGTVNQ